MNDVTLKVINSIAEDILSIAHLVMNENGLAESALNENIQSAVELSENFMIKLLFNDYIDYIENGRRPNSGEMPPISELRQWALRKGIPTDNGTLYAIAQSIKQQGIAPRPILASLEEKIEQSFTERWADNLFEAITKELDNLFT